MSEPEVDEFFRRMEQSHRDISASVWREFERAALLALRVGVVEMRLDPEALRYVKAGMPREHFPERHRENGDMLLFGGLWVGVAR